MAETPKNVIALPADISLTSVLDIQTLINKESSNESAIQLDAQAVDRFDAASLQLLIAFAQSELAYSPAITNQNELLLKGFEDIGTGKPMMSQLFDTSSEVSSLPG